jgi:DNA-binding LacI/PurR family transcriptional regulator
MLDTLCCRDRKDQIRIHRTDNSKGGRESLKQLAVLVSGKRNIVVITITGQSNLDYRVAGVADALANCPF